jgi:hypothetical protein
MHVEDSELVAERRRDTDDNDNVVPVADLGIRDHARHSARFYGRDRIAPDRRGRGGPARSRDTWTGRKPRQLARIEDLRFS